MNKAASALLFSFALAGMIPFFAGCAPAEQDAAQHALDAGRLDEAVANADAALHRDPDNPKLKSLAADIYTRRGVQHYQRGEMIQAGDDFHRAVDYDPTYAMAWDYLGLLAYNQNDWRNAVDYGDKAAGLEGKPDPQYVVTARRYLNNVDKGRLPEEHAKRHRYSGY